MSTNEPSSLQFRAFPLPSKQAVHEDTLTSHAVQIERKTIYLTLKENSLGRFLRISEEVGGRRNSVIIPATGLADFCRMVEEMFNASKILPLRQGED